jgi:dihydrofolate reductase
MSKLVYATIMSLDGYTADEAGDFEWGAPDPDVFARINELQRGFGTQLYGRRMYETLVYWENFGAAGEGDPAAVQEHAFADAWRAADKVVYSRSLEGVTSARTRIERAFDPAAVRQMKETAGHDLSIGGPELAGQALVAGLIDELHLFVVPLTVGGGKAALPAHSRFTLELVLVERFAGGVAHLQYRIGG